MYQEILILVGGLVVLILGGEFLIRGAQQIAVRAHISPLVIGLTVVAFGTSAPELFISLRSALQGSSDFIMGNVIGSNICNLAMILGITAIISPFKVHSSSIKRDWPVVMGASLLLYFIMKLGYINYQTGLLLLVILVVYLVSVIYTSRKQIKEERENLAVSETPIIKQTFWKDLAYIMIGAAGLFFGSEWFVGGAKDLAIGLGVSERIIGVTVLALGTSLPELVTASIAAYKKETDLAVGNLIGSNIFNILFILGATGLVTDINISAIIMQVDMTWMLGVTLIIFPMMVFKQRMGRASGIILLLIYVTYIYTVISG